MHSWVGHLEAYPLARGERAVFNVETLCREHGEGTCAVQAALWLEIKRFYMEQRPHLRRVYAATRDWATYAPSFHQLGFKRFGSLDSDGETYALIVLDMGPGSVDGWLAGLVAAELGIERDDLLDIDAHELVLDGRRVALTHLEFGVMRYLADRQGKVASRIALESDVWGYEYHGGSNVVDTVVRALRKKLGDQASVIETVHGTGYRLRRR